MAYLFECHIFKSTNISVSVLKKNLKSNLRFFLFSFFDPLPFSSAYCALCTVLAIKYDWTPSTLTFVASVVFCDRVTPLTARISRARTSPNSPRREKSRWGKFAWLHWKLHFSRTWLHWSKHVSFRPPDCRCCLSTRHSQSCRVTEEDPRHNPSRVHMSRYRERTSDLYQRCTWAAARCTIMHECLLLEVLHLCLKEYFRS